MLVGRPIVVVSLLFALFAMVSPRSGDKVQGRGKVYAAAGEGSDLRSWLLEAWQAVESDGAGDPWTDLGKLSRWIEELSDGDEHSESNTARHALNLVHARNSSGVHTKPLKWLLAFLKQHGVFEIPVAVGVRFDSSFSPNKFDRRMERSKKPEGTILSVMTPGLVDRQGLALQKAVLAVSSGGE